jgi:hypothetical protein
LWVRKSGSHSTNILLDLWNLLASDLWDHEYVFWDAEAAEYVDEDDCAGMVWYVFTPLLYGGGLCKSILHARSMHHTLSST